MQLGDQLAPRRGANLELCECPEHVEADQAEVEHLTRSGPVQRVIWITGRNGVEDDFGGSPSHWNSGVSKTLPCKDHRNNIQSSSLTVPGAQKVSSSSSMWGYGSDIVMLEEEGKKRLEQVFKGRDPFFFLETQERGA